jgi:hypothetical protein
LVGDGASQADSGVLGRKELIDRIVGVGLGAGEQAALGFGEAVTHGVKGVGEARQQG